MDIFKKMKRKEFLQNATYKKKKKNYHRKQKFENKRSRSHFD